GDNWTTTVGSFHRVSDGIIRAVGATGTGSLCPVTPSEFDWVVRPGWVEREAIRAFVAEPLNFRNELLGVVAIFGRIELDRSAAAWLRGLGTHAAIALGSSRAFEEINRLRSQLTADPIPFPEERGRAAPRKIVAVGPKLSAVLEQVDLVARTDASVLILG